MGGAISALVPPRRVSVEVEVGGANTRQGSDTCSRRVVLLKSIFLKSCKFETVYYLPSCLCVGCVVSIPYGTRPELHPSAVDGVSRQFPATELTNQIESCQMLGSETGLATPSSDLHHTHWLPRETGQGHRIPQYLSPLHTTHTHTQTTRLKVLCYVAIPTPSMVDPSISITDSVVLLPPGVASGSGITVELSFLSSPSVSRLAGTTVGGVLVSLTAVAGGGGAPGS